MKDSLHNVDVIPALKDQACTVCGDTELHIILVEEEENLCTDCYVNRFGWKDFYDNYRPLAKMLGIPTRKTGKIWAEIKTVDAGKDMTTTAIDSMSKQKTAHTMNKENGRIKSTELKKIC